MVPVGGRPFLDYVLTWLRSEGVEEVVLCLGYKRSSIQRYVGKGCKWGLRVMYSIEQKLLGTAGAVKNAEALISGERLLVINGDTLTGVNVRQLVDFHRNRRAWATLTVVKVADDRRYGSVKMDRIGRITTFLEKRSKRTSKDGQNRKRPINAGVYVFEKKLLNKIQAREPISLEKDVLPPLVGAGRTYGFVSDTYFVDIGVPDDLRRVQTEFQRLRVGNPY
jgi:D-glycero-alpha-D-manno-heptose 1-phosphate guanylyltransferase